MDPLENLMNTLWTLPRRSTVITDIYVVGIVLNTYM